MSAAAEHVVEMTATAHGLPSSEMPQMGATCVAKARAHSCLRTTTPAADTSILLRAHEYPSGVSKLSLISTEFRPPGPGLAVLHPPTSRESATAPGGPPLSSQEQWRYSILQRGGRANILMTLVGSVAGALGAQVFTPYWGNSNPLRALVGAHRGRFESTGAAAHLAGDSSSKWQPSMSGPGAPISG